MPRMSLEYTKHIVSQKANAQFNTDADGNRVQHKNNSSTHSSEGGWRGFSNGTFNILGNLCNIIFFALHS
jgi:hypothetical protein